MNSQESKQAEKLEPGTAVRGVRRLGVVGRHLFRSDANALSPQPRNTMAERAVCINPVAAATTTLSASSEASSSSDYLHLDELLSASEKEIRYRVRSFSQKEILPIIDDYYERAAFPHELLPKLAALNLCSGNIQGYGCPKMSGLECGLVAMELAKVDAGMATFYSILQPISMLSIYKSGSEEQKKELLPKMASLQLIGCFGLTEPDAGSDASNLYTTAKKVEGGWLLNGRKRWIGNGTFADVIIIWAINADTKKVHGFIVRKGARGLKTIKIENKIALRAVQNADIVLEDCFVPDQDQLVAAKDFKTGPASSLFLTRIMAGWIALGTAMGAYERCLAYLKQRRQFGVPLARLQILQEKVVRMLGTIQCITLLCWRVSSLYDARTLSFGQASLAKATSTRMARSVLKLARECMGGNGVVTDFGVARAFADIEAVYTFEGSYEINSLITGREVTGHAAFRP
ncbi:Acyl-coenzyme A oxidase 4, peroxisomal [Balamuthia mandrillaris]